VIDTGDAQPVSCHQYSYGYHESNIIEEQLHVLHNNGWVDQMITRGMALDYCVVLKFCKSVSSITLQSHWSSGMIPRSGRGGPGFESRVGPILEYYIVSTSLVCSIRYILSGYHTQAFQNARTIAGDKRKHHTLGHIIHTTTQLVFERRQTTI
jgi:hypothetical protein